MSISAPEDVSHEISLVAPMSVLDAVCTQGLCKQVGYSMSSGHGQDGPEARSGRAAWWDLAVCRLLRHILGVFADGEPQRRKPRQEKKPQDLTKGISFVRGQTLQPAPVPVPWLRDVV